MASLSFSWVLVLLLLAIYVTLMDQTEGIKCVVCKVQDQGRSSDDETLAKLEKIGYDLETLNSQLPCEQYTPGDEKYERTCPDKKPEDPTDYVCFVIQDNGGSGCAKQDNEFNIPGKCYKHVVYTCDDTPLCNAKFPDQLCHPKMEETTPAPTNKVKTNNSNSNTDKDKDTNTASGGTSFGILFLLGFLHVFLNLDQN